MRLVLVFGVVGQVLRLFSLAFVPPIALALSDGEGRVAGNFALAMGASVAAGSWMARGIREAPVFRRSEALAVVAMTWLVVGQFAAIPYVLEGLRYVDAVFESISGFTTTGATILQDFSAHGRAFFLWRGMTQWFGGLGVIALFVVILPRLGIAGRQLFFAEASANLNDPIAPHIRQVAQRLWLVYLLLTLAEILLLRSAAGMPLYDAVCNSLATMAAGGFSPHALSISGYENPAAEWIFIVFMLLAGASFVLQWRALTGHPRVFFLDGEFLFYIGVTLAGAVGVAFVLDGGLPSLDTFRTAAFQSASLISSTGFASTDYNLWSDAALVILVVVMLVGGCAGSAAGGAKAVRHLLVAKFLRREVTRVLHPQAVIPLRYNGRPVPEEIMRAVFTLVVLYLAGYLTIAALLVLLGADFVTGFSAALACLGNIGPGFRVVGPMGNYADLPDASKAILTLAMWIGRLEIVTVLALLHPDVLRSLRWSARGRGARS